MARFKDLNALTIYHNMMSITGIWPRKNPGIFYKIRTLSSWILMVGVTLAMCMEAANDLTDFTKLSEILYILITWSATLVKQAALECNKKLFWDVLDFLDDPIVMSYPGDLNHHMVDSIKQSNMLAKISRFLYMSSATLYVLYPALDNLPLPFPFPYDLGQYTYIMYIVQSAGEVCAAWNCCCLDTLCWCLMSLAVAQLKILEEKITRLTWEVNLERKNFQMTDGVEERVLVHLKQCVGHHLAIIKFIDLIERIFTWGFLGQFLASIITVCNTVFHFILISVSVQFALLVMYLVCMLEQLFLYCWYGNEIILKSEKIKDACYSANWNKCGFEVRKYLFIIMERSKRPVKITALKFSTVSLASFGSILQWSYSCLALMLKMYSKRSLK